MTVTWIILWALQACWLVMALLSVLQCHRLLHRLRHDTPRRFSPDLPRAWLIVPFKGLDVDLPGCVRSLCTQHYHDYQLILVVDSTEDPAYPILVREAARYPRRSVQILVAGPTQDRQSQKIHNQLHALAQVLPQAAPQEVLVFADSDAVPGDHWLLEMVVPVTYAQVVGMSTGYRWLVPQADPATGKPSLWSHLASLMNSSVACIYRNQLTNRAWGGAMAVTVATALEQDLVGHLRGALTDDYQFTRLCRKTGKRLWFAPRCLVPTPVHFDFRDFVNFVRRQYLITRVYAPGTFVTGLALLTFWVAGMLATWVALVLAWLDPPQDQRGWIPAGVLVIVAVLHQARSHFRRQVVRAAFGQQTLTQLRRTLLLDRWCTWVWMTLHWLLMLSACAGRRIAWRGITYRVRGRQDVIRLS